MVVELLGYEIATALVLASGKSDGIVRRVQWGAFFVLLVAILTVGA